MKLELFLMFLCFLLASFVVLADETDNGHKDDDHVQQAEDARWDQQFFDWPWSKRKATDINEDEKLWPWQSDVTKEDEKLWPWKSSDVTKEDEKLWPWLSSDVSKEADETDNGHKDDDHVQQAEDARWGRRKGRRKPGRKQDWPWQKKTALEDQQFFDWPWSKRKATDINEDEKLWPWQSDVTKEDEKLWPWKSSDVTKEDEKLWPWLSSDVTKEEGKTLEDEALQLVS